MPAFLFTDLESSTRLWEQHPDEMAVALARHDTILREAIGEGGGTIVKSTGDGLLAVFDSVTSTLIAAVAAQIALRHERWATSDPLRVRMGVHFGEGESRDGDYFGPAVNRAARIMSAAHGGQVLLSTAAAGLADGAFPDGITMRDLGLHRLKDLTLPEHLYQLVHGALETEFPPPTTLDARPNNLPMQVSEFFGRDNELASIQLMLGAPTTRLLTLAGPGGAGKTRLGLQVAAEQLDRFADGVFFVDLSAEAAPDSAFEAVVRTLGFPVTGGGHPLEVLQARLRDQQLLLVLDNLEQVTAAAAGIVVLLQHCPGLKVLATSRESLRVRGEHVFPVPAMSLPHPKASSEEIASSEAVRLFVDRARSVRPSFALSEDNASIIAEICLRLDGLPLAIELAAARLNVFSPGELMERLRTRLDVLGAGGRDLPDRQRTLWGAIGWSYELLDPTERRLFEMMSVFSAARMVALEEVAASAMGGLDLDALASLVDKSLVRSVDHDGVQRFSMLQTIREYAAERLADSAEFEQAVRNAHAVHFSAHAQELARELRGADRESALEELGSAIGNLRTAWRHWVDRADGEQILALVDSLWALHDAKGWYHAAIELANDALGVITATGTSTDTAVEELTLRTSLARALMAVRGYTPEVESAFRQVLDLAAVTGEATQLFPVVRVLATYYMSTTDFEKAAELGHQLLELADREDDQSIRVDGHYVVGAATAFSGDLQTGLDHLDRCVRMFDPRIHVEGRFRLGPSPGVLARVASGLLRWQSGALDQAVAGVEDALNLARELAHPYSLAYALYHHGLLQLYRTRFADAGERARELAEVAADHDYPVWGTLACVLEGVSLSELGEVEEGLALTEKGVTVYVGLTTPPIFWPLILGLRARVFASAGDAARGLELIDESIGAYGADQVQAAEHHIVRGDILRLLGRPAEADEAYLTAVQGSAAGSIHLIGLQAATRLVESRRETGTTPDGADELRSFLAAITEGHQEPVVQRALSLLE